VSDLNYTLIESALEIGGAVKMAVDLTTGEVLQIVEQAERQPSSAEVSCGQDTARGGAPLSKVHKTPFVEWASGGGLLKVSRGIACDAPKGGKRGKVKGFSFASRRRLMYTIAKIKLDAELPVFITLTYPFEFPSPMESKKHIDVFRKRLLRTFPNIGYIWKLEPQQRGAPHYHIMAWGAELEKLGMFVVDAWYEIAGGGDIRHKMFHMGLYQSSEPCVQAVRSRKGVMSYASKYLGKTFEVAGWDEIYPGRFWAVVQKENIPFGQDMTMNITDKDAKIWMRYQRRFAKMKSRKYFSLTTFCNSEKWISNLLEVHQGEK